jgi:fumarate reductase subunit C
MTSADGEPTRAYRQPVARYWWAQRRSYRLFMLREISCVFVAWFVAYLLLLVNAVGAGRDSYLRFLDWSASPVVVWLNVIALIFLVLHAITWFGSAPRAMVVHIRGNRVPARAVLAGHYAAWLVVSAVVAWMVMS